VKKYLAKHFNEWYTTQVTKQLENGTALEEIDVKLCVSLLKPLQAEWLVTLYNELTSLENRGVILSGWRASGITDVVKMGSSKLPSLDPFQDLDQMIEGTAKVSVNLSALCSENAIGLPSCDNDFDVDDGEYDEEIWQIDDDERDIFEQNFVDDEST
jgi:hypothetical protein